MTLVELTREELKQKALLQGIRKGEQLGIRKGREEGRTEVILKMLKEKVELTTISKVTGLTISEIKKLKNNRGHLKNGK